MTFSASYERAAKIISALVCLFFLAVIVETHSSLFSIIALLLILVSYAYSPRGYVITDRSILVQRLAGQPRIALDHVREVRRATPDDFRRSIRLRGSSGLFGYYGLFRSPKLGKFTAYVTNRNNRVVVITGSKTALFSPDDVDGFLNAVHASAPIPAP
jgi:Bacterial PH domain